MQLKRRHAITGAGALAAGASLMAQAPAQDAESALVRRHDEAVAYYLKTQTLNSERWRGGVPDGDGLHHAGGAAGLIETLTVAWLHPGSRHHKNAELIDRLKLAVRFLEAHQSPEGNVDLLTTNYNSPPDSGFVCTPIATAALLARRAGARDIENLFGGFLRKSGAGMAAGGIHTPNHRWVVSAALAQIHELYPDPSYVRRIDAWLAEGIDIDGDGQYTERSTAVYNPICNRSFVILANKLKRPELLNPVRRNLDAMLYLLHPGYEVVTEISRRQDQYQRGDMGGYWFSLRYLAATDNNGVYGRLASAFEDRRAHLAALMEYPELRKPLPAPAEPPSEYVRTLPELGVTRIRRGATSATLLHSGNSRFFWLRRGEGQFLVRFASAFFGKAQFVPQRHAAAGGRHTFTQDLEAPYYQPLDPPERVTTENTRALWAKRKRTQICKLTQSAVVEETPRGFRLRLRAEGTNDVPVAVEIATPLEGELAGVAAVAKVPGAYTLAAGEAVWKHGGETVRFGPGRGEHVYTQVRGAEEKLPGRCVYLCGYTPFEHTVEFTFG